MWFSVAHSLHTTKPLMRLELRLRDPNDATDVNQVFVGEGDTLRTKRGPLVLGDMLGQGAGGKVFVLQGSDCTVVKVIRRYRLEARIAAMLQIEPCPNAIPILEVRKAGDYAVIVMPLGKPVYTEDLEAVNLNALYEPVETYLAVRRLRYTDSRVPRNMIKLDGQIRIIDFSHVRWIRAPRRRLRAPYQPPLP